MTALALVLAVLLAGCGGGGEDECERRTTLLPPPDPNATAPILIIECRSEP